MRKKEALINDTNEVVDILRRALVMRLAFCGDEPYLVPLNFAFHQGCIYFHTGHKGKKMEMLRKDDRVCFEVDLDVKLLPSDQPCKWACAYASVVGFGRALALEDEGEKAAALSRLMEKYAGLQGCAFPPAKLKAAAVVRINIESMTGRRMGLGGPAEEPNRGA
jgi:nitroimidazol reductase NimA-like FMN-containing flavoprotein (pyridoxamine 5'-phosphate oxidase superfamily)